MSMEGFNPLPGSDPEVGRAVVRIEAVYDKLASDARNAVSQFNREMANAGQGVQQGMAVANRAIEDTTLRSVLMYRTLLAGITTVGAAVAAVMVTSARSAVQYEAQFAGVRKTVDATEKDLARLSQQFIELSKHTATSAADLAKLAGAAGALGVASGDIYTFVKAVDTLTLATDVGAGQAAQSLGTLGKQLNLTGQEYERLSSTVVALSNKMAATGAQVLTTAERAANAAKRIGLDPQDLLAFSATLNSIGGVEQGAAGTILDAVFGNIGEVVAGSRAAEDAARKLGLSMSDLRRIQEMGGDVAERYARSIGMTGDELRRLITISESAKEMARVSGTTVGAMRTEMERDPAAAMQRFLQGLAKLDAYAQQNVLRKIGLGDEHVARGVIALAENIDELNKALGIGPKAWDENRAAADAAAKQLDTVAGRLAMLQNQFEAIQLEIGEKFLPVLKEALTWISDNLPQMWESLKDVWSRILGPAVETLTEALLRLGGAIADVFTDWSFFGPLLGQTGDKANAAESALDGVASVLAMLVGYVTQFVDGITTLLKLPFVKEMLQFGIMLGAVAAQLKLIQTLVGGLRGAGIVLNMMTGGRLGGLGSRGGTPESTAMIGAAGAHTKAAGSLMAAAAALQAGASSSALSLSDVAQSLQMTGLGPIPASAFGAQARLLRMGLAGGAPQFAIPGQPWVPGNFGQGFNWGAPTQMQGWRQRDMSYVRADDYYYGERLPGAEVLPPGVHGPVRGPVYGPARPGLFVERNQLNQLGSARFTGPQMDPRGFTWRGAGQMGRDLAINPITGMPGSFALDNGMPIAIGYNPQSRAMHEAQQRAARLATMSNSEQIAFRAREEIAKGVGAVRGGLRALPGAASAALGVASKVFWGALVADMIANIAAAPIANIVAQATGHDRLKLAGEKGAAELLAGIWQTFITGTSEYVERGNYQIGNTTLTGAQMRDLGVPGSQLDILEAGGFGGLQEAAKIAGRLPEKLAALPPTMPESTYTILRGGSGGGNALTAVEDFNRRTLEELAAAFIPEAERASINQLQGDERWAAIRAALDRYAKGTLDVANQNVTDSFNGALRAIGLDMPGFVQEQLGPTMKRAFYGMATVAAQGGPGAQMLADWAIRREVSSLGVWRGGAQALPENVAQLRERFEAYQTSRAQLPQEERAAGEFARQFMRAYYEEFESAAGAGDEAKRRLLEQVVGPDQKKLLGDPTELARIWDEWWATAIPEIKQIGGYDEQAALAQQAQDLVAAAMRDGMSADEIRQAFGAEWDLLFDGLGDEAVERGRRIADAFWSAFGEEFTAADTTAEQAAFVAKMEEVFGITLPGGSTTGKMRSAADLRIQSMMDEIMVAGPDERASIAERLRAEIPEEFAPATWDEMVRRGAPALRGEYEAGTPEQRADIMDQLNRARGTLGPGQKPWTEAEVAGMMKGTDMTAMLDSLAAMPTAAEANTDATAENTAAVEALTTAIQGFLGGGAPPPPGASGLGPSLGFGNINGLNRSGIRGIPFLGEMMRHLPPGWSGRATAGASPPRVRPAAALPRSATNNRATGVTSRAAAFVPGTNGGANGGSRSSTQSIHVDNMTILGPQDEESVLRQFAFISTGR